jgi:hypothetical protein
MLRGLTAHIKARYMHHILHKQIYAGLFEIIKDKRCYYHSSVGQNYCHLTEEGKEAVVKWLEMTAWEMLRLEQAELDARAKKMMWEELKK